MIKETINYADNDYVYNYSSDDRSGIGCIIEIIQRDEYKLNMFKNLKNKTIIDIGANHGLATIILAKQNPESIIYSFEPNIYVFKWLEQNVKDNNLTNVKIYNKAIHSFKKLKIVMHPNCSGLSIMADNSEKLNSFYNDKHIDVYGYAEVKELEIETESIDEFLNSENIKNIHLLKIDCEGSEFDILTTSNLIFKDVKIDNIIGEFHNLSYNPFNMNANDLLKICKNNIDGVVDIKILNLE
jgi:FkbM family methyltransferase